MIRTKEYMVFLMETFLKHSALVVLIIKTIITME